MRTPGGLVGVDGLPHHDIQFEEEHIGRMARDADPERESSLLPHPFPNPNLTPTGWFLYNRSVGSVAAHVVCQFTVSPTRYLRGRRACTLSVAGSGPWCKSYVVPSGRRASVGISLTLCWGRPCARARGLAPCRPRLRSANDSGLLPAVALFRPPRGFVRVCQPPLFWPMVSAPLGERLRSDRSVPAEEEYKYPEISCP